MQIPNDILKQCWFLAGPTACGKSEAAIVLAERLDAEILSMDSMSLYRGMDLGTAKPSVAQRAMIPHHLLDLCEPHEAFSVAQYLAAADAVARGVVSRDRVPLFVGGTGLYLRALLRGVFDGPQIPPELRKELEADVESSSTQQLHERLALVDPRAARRIHARDGRRIVRALEVFLTTGRPLSEQQRQNVLPPRDRPQNVYWLSPPRRWLYERIDRRVERMFAEGLVDEVCRLLAAPLGLSHTARQALGYKEVLAHLEQGVPLTETLALIQTRTRQFAKRQHTWFRHLEECRPVEMTGAETASQLAEMVLKAPGATAV
ncbi:MAG TPA: tRNA (adenosine(37)-N6)-dimethylallyltransferase MiaA [Planctomycetaceae bacterium]|jgi:tRNA dimethylallyltransferase|nr:tRNA (adenosine(37)-N6)-dimethylallyltransferase MiaA [Planctomycetaceae bacterium]